MHVAKQKQLALPLLVCSFTVSFLLAFQSLKVIESNCRLNRLRFLCHGLFWFNADRFWTRPSRGKVQAGSRGLIFSLPAVNGNYYECFLLVRLEEASDDITGWNTSIKRA